MNVRQLLALAAIVLMVGPAVGPALAAVQTVFVGGGTPIGTQTGLTVKPANDEQLNLEDPWVRSDAVQLHNVTFSGQGGELTVDTFGDPNSPRQWTNTSLISTNSNRVYINRTDTTKRVGVAGDADDINVTTLDLAENTDNVDVVASAGADWTLIINNTGQSAGTGIVAENADTGAALDSAAVNNNGHVVLDELEQTSDTEINLRVGPSELFVYNESAPDQLVTNTDLRVRVFGTNEVFEREVTGGTMDLTGIPTDERLAITVEGEGDYTYRRITVDSVTEQEEVYLLNTSNANVESASVDFNVNDQTGGTFSTDETTLFIEAPITKDFDGDGDDETRYQVISGDVIGSSGEYPATLERDNRYRLRVVNEDGDRRILGSYVVEGDAAPTVQIGEVRISDSEIDGYLVQLRDFEQDSNGDGTNESFVQVVYRDEAERTTELRYTITNLSNGNAVTSENIPGTLGQHTATFQVDQNSTASSFRLDYEIDREQPNGSEVTRSGQRFAGSAGEIRDALPIDTKWLDLIGYVSIVAVAGLIVIRDSALAAVAATGWSGLLTVLGIVAIPAPALGLAGAISVIALAGRTR